MTQKHFDTIIIGSGTSAAYCAAGLLEAGKSIAIIDERPFGGTCALRGCQPKKYLVANTNAVMGARHLLERGIVGDPRVDWPALQAHKNEFLEGRSEDEFAEWRKAGATPILGPARNDCRAQTGPRILLDGGRAPERLGGRAQTGDPRGGARKPDASWRR